MADNKEFTEEEIIGNWSEFNSKKDPGEDGITSGILISAFEASPRFFTKLYNVCLREGYFPKQWKHSIIIPIIEVPFNKFD